jgi:hypothetical protein
MHNLHNWYNWHNLHNKSLDMKNKRLLICIIGGIIAGLICSAGGHLSGNISELSFFTIAPTFFNRLMLGFIIGISSLKMNYLFHGALIGLLVSLITSIPFLEGGVNGFLLFTIAGIIYGILIELFATKVFKAKTD